MNSTSLYRREVNVLPSDEAQIEKEWFTIDGLMYQAGISFTVGLAAFLLFCFMRSRHGAIYEKRCKVDNGNSTFAQDLPIPRPLPSGIFTWIPALVNVSEPDFLAIAGLDGVMLMRFLKMCLHLCAMLTIVGVGVLIPINLSGGTISPARAPMPSDIRKLPIVALSFYNIDETRFLWAHVAIAYLFTIVIILVLVHNDRFFIRARRLYFASDQYRTSLQNRTLMFHHLPPKARDDVKRLVRYVVKHDERFPVANAVIARRLGQLPKVLKEHEKTVRELEVVLFQYLQDATSLTMPRPQMQLSKLTVDTIDHYAETIETLEYQIRLLRDPDRRTLRPISIGFVSYYSPEHAHRVAERLSTATQGLVTLAPHPDDIIWVNAELSPSTALLHRWIGRLLFVLFALVATVPVSALTAVTSINNVSVLLPKVGKFFATHPTVATLWQSTVSPFILLVYYAIVPQVFRIIAKFQGIATETAVERSVMKKFFTFMIISNIFVFALVHTVMDILHATNGNSNNNSNIDRIVVSLNKSASFWTSYVSLRTINPMVELGQIGSLLLSFSRNALLLPRTKMEARQPQPFDYATVYSIQLFILTMLLIYSVYAPLVLPFGLFNYVCVVLVFKHQLLYVYRTKVQTGGAMWRPATNRLLFSTLCFQMYTLYALKLRTSSMDSRQRASSITSVSDSVNIQWWCMIPLPVLTIVAGIARGYWLDNNTQYSDQLLAAKSNNSGNGSRLESNHDVGLDEMFRHPAFSKPLITPMVNPSVRAMLPLVYGGR
ncbi:DUF221-domain-containing protein, partial [Ramicandelaber brevisporus]